MQNPHCPVPQLVETIVDLLACLSWPTAQYALKDGWPIPDYCPNPGSSQWDSCQAADHLVTKLEDGKPCRVIQNQTLAHIHALRTYLRGLREAYRWDLYCAHLGKKAAESLDAELHQAYIGSQEALMVAARRSLGRVRNMERKLDQIMAELREETDAAPESPTEAWLLAWRGGD